MDGKFLQLKSQDGKIIKISFLAARFVGAFKAILCDAEVYEDSNQIYQIPHIKGSVLSKIVEWCEMKQKLEDLTNEKQLEDIQDMQFKGKSEYNQVLRAAKLLEVSD